MEIKVVRTVLGQNENLAREIRKILKEKHQTMINFMSSPGSGKTQLLDALIPPLKARGLKVGVIEGDITTSNDAQRLQSHDIPIAQINTEFFGGDCHLAANVILGAMTELSKEKMDIILLENVGNLVCPAEFDTGSDLNVVLISVTEGEDKPLKYPLMFRNSKVALINKIDIAKAVEADVQLLETNILKVNPEITIFQTSGKKKTGIDNVAELIVNMHKNKF